LTVDGTATALNDVHPGEEPGGARAERLSTRKPRSATGSVPWILTRATYFDQPAEMLKGFFTFRYGGGDQRQFELGSGGQHHAVGTDA